MRVKGLAAAALACALGMGATAHAALVRDYELNGSLTDSAGSGFSLTNNGASLGAAGLSFGANQGPTLTDFNLSQYTLVTSFSLTDINGFRKLIDFKNLSTDQGLYDQGGELNFYNAATGFAGAIQANAPVQVALTRDSVGRVTGYVGGVSQFTFFDSATNLAVTDANHVLNFFRDDSVTGGNESSTGFVDYIRVYDTALSSSEIAALSVPGGVPEPATWALMIAGFGGAGVLLRRRRALSAA